MTRKLYAAFFALMMLTASNVFAACANLNVTGSGGSLAPNQEVNVYGPYSVSCTGSQSFTFQDLSGSSNSNKLTHYFERQNGSTWVVVSSSSTTGATTVNKNFSANITGTYRYRIVNTGTTTLKNWSMSGRVTLFTIPGT